MKLAAILSLTFASLVHSQTIADLITQNAGSLGINKAAALVSSNPEWAAAGTNSLFVPADSVPTPPDLPEGDIGHVFTDKVALDFDAGDENTNSIYNYWAVVDTKGQKRFIYDDYNWGKTETLNIHIRTGTQQGKVISGHRASNGFLFVIDTAFVPPAPNEETAAANGLDAFFAKAKEAGVADLINGLRDVTFWIPNNTAIAAAEPQLSALTRDQLAYTLLSHITQGTTYTSVLTAAPFRPVLQNGPSSSISAAGNGWAWNNIPLAGPAADVMTAGGVFQPLSQVYIPQSFGSVTLGSGVSTVAPTTTTTTTNPTSGTSSSTSSSVSAAGSTPTNKQDSSAKGIVPGVAAVVAGFCAVAAFF